MSTGFGGKSSSFILRFPSIGEAHAECARVLGKREERKVGNNTTLRRDSDGGYVIRYHSTDIIMVREKSVTLETRGWQTSTTKLRLNAILPRDYSITQADSLWTLHKRPGESFAFADGITLHANGKVTGAGKATPEAMRKLKRRIAKYATGFAEEMATGKVPAPSRGDCLFCMLRTTTGDSLGEAQKDTSHLDSHIDECYYVPSLLVNAAKLHPRGGYFLKGLAPLVWDTSLSSDKRDQFLASSYGRRLREDTKRMVVRYMQRLYGFASQ